MILMSVGDHKASDLVNIFLEICDIRNDKIDSQHIIPREGKTTVYYHDIVLVLKCGNIHTDLLQTTQRDDLKPLTNKAALCLLV